MKVNKLNRFYTHIHKPTNTVKVGVTSQSIYKRLVNECEKYHRDMSDYIIIHNVETLDCWQIERDCIKMLAEKYSSFKVVSDEGKKIYQERFHYYRPIMRKIKKIVNKYA